MDYLAIRQQLKETFRAKLRKQSGHCGTKQTTAPIDNYGNFFGPSEVAFTGRVLEESKGLHKKLKINQPGDSKGALLKKVEKLEKIKNIKESRDYSFLLSDDHCDKGKIGDVRVQETITKKVGIRNISPAVGTEKKRSSKHPSNIIKNVSSNSRVVVDKPKDSTKKSCDLKKQLGKKRKIERRNREEDDEENAIDMIRKMFRYDPSKFRDHRYDDKCMEASFADIQKEERRSAKIASKEDAEELEKLVREKKRIIVKTKAQMK